MFFRYSKAVEIPKSAQKAPAVRTRRDGGRWCWKPNPLHRLWRRWWVCPWGCSWVLWVGSHSQQLWGLLGCTSGEDQIIRCWWNPSRPGLLASAQGWVCVADNQFPRGLVPDLPEEAPGLMSPVFSWLVLWYWNSPWHVTFSLGHLG